LTDTGSVVRRPLHSVVPVIAGCAVLPVTPLWLVRGQMVMPPAWVHFYGVGVSALLAMVAAVALTTAGATVRRCAVQDPRTERRYVPG